jgi:peptidyl-prolyl cis-trans isomerase C
VLKKNHFVALAIVAALAINPAFAEDKSAATVNGVAISQARIDMSVKAAQAQGREDSPELRKAIRDELINREVMVQAAKKEGLDKSAEVAQEIEFSRQTVLINAFVQDQLKKNPVTEAQLQQEYNSLKAKLGDKEYNVSHILVKTEDQAKAIIAKLGKKVKFETLAKESIDTGSAEHGGLLGWQAPRTFVEPFANALLTLKKGEYTKVPVQTQFGWHVIKLDDVRPLKVPSFDELKPKLLQRLQQQQIQKEIMDLRAAAKIE